MIDLKKYQIATLVLAVAVLVLASVLFAKTETNTVTDNLDKVSMKISDCRKEIADLTKDNKAGEAMSMEKQDEMNKVYSKCIDSLEEAQAVVK